MFLTSPTKKQQNIFKILYEIIMIIIIIIIIIIINKFFKIQYNKKKNKILNI